ncbi:MAG TPA: nuclear transport factor 2 family protein [Acidimicrobiia bacterium]|nr:nuclear transport factor 2 family protein [Acidimicrobiia bacterium]
MPTTTELDEAIERSHRALRDALGGDPEGYRGVLSDRDDVTLANPSGLFARGPEAVSEALAGAGETYPEAELLGFDPVARYVTDDLACVVEVELYRARVETGDAFAVLGLRATTVFRFEDGHFHLVHRHAAPVSPR